MRCVKMLVLSAASIGYVEGPQSISLGFDHHQLLRSLRQELAGFVWDAGP